MSPIVRLIIVLLTIIFVFKSRFVSGEAKSPPYFVTQPPREEILFYVESEDSNTIRSFEIPCEAKGDPEPDYFYTKNGVLFNWTTEGNRITREQGTGTLRISPTKVSDVGQYQCFAENIWGIATSNSIFARRIELNSFRNDKPVKKEALEGQPFSLACQPPGGYPKPTTNWLTQDFTGKLNGIEDPRITVDPTGTLWFSNVTLDDAIEDSVYACAVTSPYISEVKTGAKVILSVTPMEETSDDNEVAPIKQYTSKTEEIATLGKKIRLYCIYGGTPLPTITWYKNDKLLQFRGGTSSKDGRKSIEIKRVTSSDEGNYTCQASNGVGDSISYTITLKVLVEPRFTKKPESVTIDEQETVEFHCQATGNPPPEIIWIHNGKPLSEAPFNPRRAVSSNSIIIEKLWKNDTGNYGCNATNSVGYVYQEAFVNVLAEPPNITQLPQNQEIIEGGTVMMSCRAEGSPKPQITWMRNNAELSDDRFTTTKNGDLTIKSTTLTDTGEYTCLAQNKISSISISANLSVREHTRIPPELAPSDTEIPAGDPATLKCSAIIDPALELTISWQQNQESIDSSDQRFVQNNNSSLTILKTSELDSGVYTCIAHTRLDDATAEASLIVQNIPNPPAIVSVSCNAKDAVISWKNTGDNRAPIINYIIQYNKISVSDMWEVIPETIPATETSFTVKMTPWTNYTFRVLAVNKIGNSLPSEPSSICSSSPPEIPYQNPKNVTIKAANESKALQISWEPMPKTNHNGPGFHYQVSWKKDTPEAEWENQTIPNWETGEYTIPNVTPYTKYLVKVTAGNDLGQSAIISETLEYNTTADIPFKNPDNVTIQTSNPKTLDISWQPIPKNDQNGPGFYYNVSWKKDTPDSEWQSQIITGPEKGEYVVQNVQPYEKYLVTVVAANDQGPASPPSEPFVLQTPPDVPDKNPENVTVHSIDPKTLEISWEPVPKNDHNGPGFHYQVSWKKDSPEAEWENQTISTWETEKFTIPNLTPFTKYLVKVTIGNDLGKSTADSKALEYNTPADIPFKNPDNLTVRANFPTSLEISWKPMEKSDQNGPGFYYNVSWKKDIPESEWQSQTIAQSEIGEYVVPNVEPYEKYLITVVSGNDLGQAISPSEPFVLQTPPDIPYKNPENVTIRATDPTTLHISWKPMPKNDHNGPGFHYNVLWKRDIPEEQWESRNVSEWETGEYIVHNVVPYEKYLVTIIAGNEIGPADSNYEPVSFTTPATIPFKNPENVTVRATEPSTSVISWKPMPKTDHNGPGFYYSVSWKIDAPGDEWESQKISEWETGEYTINIPSYEKHFVTVVAGNDEGPCTQPPITVEGYYEEDVPLEAPSNLALVEILSSTKVNISWNRVPKAALRGNFQGYKIETWPEHDQQKGNVTEVNIEQNFNNAVIDKLTPNTKNKIRIQVLNGKHAGPFSEELEIDTPEGVPEPVQSAEATPVGSSALTVAWKPPLITNGRLTGYKIYYQTVSETESGPLIEGTPQITDPNDTKVKLTGLEPDTNYKIIIQATTNAGDGEKMVIEQKTKPMPNVPMIKPDFEFEQIESENSTDVKVIWLPCGADTDTNCNDQPIGSEFRVDYALKEDTEFQTVVEKNDRNVTIRNLQPNKEYKFMVSSVDGTLVANSSIKPFKTSEIPTIPEKHVLALEQTELETTEEPTIQSTEKSSPETVTRVEPMKDSGNFTIMWLVVLLSIALLVIVIALIVIYLKKLNEGDKYIVREQEIKNRRPDWPEDPDFPEVTQPLNEEVPVDQGSSPKPDKDGMVMIPLN